MQATIPGDTQDKYSQIELAIERIKAGEQQAYEIIIRQFERQMYTYCFYILKNHEATEDAVQDIFIRAYEHLHQYSRQTSFSAWLYKIAYHPSKGNTAAGSNWFSRSRNKSPSPKYHLIKV